jgi:hypothetical protein
VKLERRSPAGQLRYLAGKLREGDELRESVALALDVLVDEMSPEEPVKRPGTGHAVLNPKFAPLAAYNAECDRGIVHTAGWDAKMAELQREYDEQAG